MHDALPMSFAWTRLPREDSAMELRTLPPASAHDSDRGGGFNALRVTWPRWLRVLAGDLLLLAVVTFGLVYVSTHTPHTARRPTMTSASHPPLWVDANLTRAHLRLRLVRPFPPSLIHHHPWSCSQVRGAPSISNSRRSLSAPS